MRASSHASRSDFPFLVGLLVAVVLAASGCGGSGSAWLEAHLSATTVNANSSGSRVTLQYSLAQPATVSVWIVDSANQQFPLREGEPRARGSYELVFNGTYPVNPRGEARRVLPNGAYRLVVDAVSAAGARQSADIPVRVEQADTSAPSIDNLAVFPGTISPNFDGVDDIARVTYRLGKNARVYGYVLTPSGDRLPLGARAPLPPGEYALQWDGAQNDVPVADGSYQVVVQAADDAGNVTISQVPLEVKAGGQPDAHVLRVEFSPRQVMVGGVVNVSITVKNSGPTVLRTQGPEPGFVYDSYSTFAALSKHQFVDRAGLWRVGVDWAGSPAGAESKYAYRWGFGHDLQPGEEIAVQGGIRILHGPDQDSGQGPRKDRMFFYAGLIHEGFAFQEDKIGGTWVAIGY